MEEHTDSNDVDAIWCQKTAKARSRSLQAESKW